MGRRAHAREGRRERVGRAGAPRRCAAAAEAGTHPLCTFSVTSSTALVVASSVAVAISTLLLCLPAGGQAEIKQAKTGLTLEF